MRRVLIVEPQSALREDLARAVRAAGYAVDGAPEVPAESTGFHAAVVDVSEASDLDRVARVAAGDAGLPILAIGSAPSVELAVEAMKRGARDFLRKPFDVRRLESALDAVLGPPRESPGAPRLLTRDPVMQRLLARTEAAAATEATLLIRGESGTGKDLLARTVHAHSPRRTGPLVAVHCSALPEALWESELFGSERGGFADAMEARTGQIAAADGGSLLLDAVSEVPLDRQPKLLRVLQEREIVPLGSVVPRRVDVRVIATTRRDLRAEVEAGRFREDLCYRLEVIALTLPPLRERPADIDLLARSFLARFADAAGSEPPLLTKDTLARLRALPFRGNVRELENLMRRAAVLYPGRAIDVDALVRRRSAPNEEPGVLGGSLDLRELERRAIVHSLARSGGNRTAASRELGISVRTLRNKIRAYGLR